MDKVVIAGGMGAGKSTLIRLLEGNGFRVVPEVVKLLHKGGFDPLHPGFYNLVFKTQLFLEAGLIDEELIDVHYDVLEQAFNCDLSPEDLHVDLESDLDPGFVFLDRSLIDLLMLCDMSIVRAKPPSELFDFVDYSSVFFIDAVINNPKSIEMALLNKDYYAFNAREAFWFKSGSDDPIRINDYSCASNKFKGRVISFPQDGLYSLYFVNYVNFNNRALELYGKLSGILGFSC